MRKCQVLGCDKNVFVGKSQGVEIENRFLCYEHWVNHRDVPELKPYQQPHEKPEVFHELFLSDAQYSQAELCKYIGTTCECALCTYPPRRTYE